MIAGIAAVLGIIALFALALVWRGLVLSIMWGWFIVPLGAPEIGVALAIGIAGTIGMITHKMDGGEKPEGQATKEMVMLFTVPLILLGLGWIVHQFA